MELAALNAELKTFLTDEQVAEDCDFVIEYEDAANSALTLLEHHMNRLKVSSPASTAHPVATTTGEDPPATSEREGTNATSTTITLRPPQTVRGKVLTYYAAAQLPKIQPKHRNTLSPAQPQKPGRRYQAQLCTRRIVSRHCRTLVRPAPSTVTTAVVAAEVPEQAEAEVGIEDHHNRRSQAPTIRRLLLPPARSLKLLQATTENHRMPQAQRGDPQEDIKDPRNRLRGQAPHHHIKSYGGTNTTANIQLTRDAVMHAETLVLNCLNHIV
ncbi:hypothetical protein HPB52_003628 [Rhipicephalus sanguineus]|uniref:Uncharacterized protein n=1 Tax=Rhipicephalus sanguineus TaxID=34632 RepID=A0A9D4PB81_RHISA|nr:hypothetical protein HPB52_003628 [Rhipicephalus sanguineus]